LNGAGTVHFDASGVSANESSDITDDGMHLRGACLAEADPPGGDMATASKQTLSDPKPAPARNVPMANPVNGSVRVEIFDQIYNLRGSDADYILKLAEYVDGKMRAVSEQTSTVDSVRLAVLAALNIADEYHLLKRRLQTPAPEVRQRTDRLANALDEVLQDHRPHGAA
jgi:cell division protein ZapA